MLSVQTQDSAERCECADFDSGEYERQFAAMNCDCELVQTRSGEVRCDVVFDGELVAMSWGHSPQQAMARSLEETIERMVDSGNLSPQ